MKVKQKAKQVLSKTSTMHYAKLVFRSALFVIALVVYIINRIRNATSPFGGLEKQPFILTFIWIVFVTEMIFRFFPSKLESMGCEKQFKRNFKPTGESTPENISWKSTFSIVIAWTILNGCIGYYN